MSAPLAPAAASGVPVIDEAHAPTAVREGSAAVKQAYASAQSFEEMLLQQLSQSMLQSSGLGGESGGEGEAGSGEGGSTGSSETLTSLLPQALSEGVMREGGLGLAAQLARSLDPATAAAPTPGSTGGEAPPAETGAAGIGTGAGMGAGMGVGIGVGTTGGVAA